jgi:hypothetical protein
MFKRYNVSLLDKGWELIIPNLKLKHIPRNGEIIYITIQEQYYKVVNVIHNITTKQEIFLVVEKLETNIKG